jgi:hypothetical protein
VQEGEREAQSVQHEEFKGDGGDVFNMTFLRVMEVSVNVKLKWNDQRIELVDKSKHANLLPLPPPPPSPPPSQLRMATLFTLGHEASVK